MYGHISAGLFYSTESCMHCWSLWSAPRHQDYSDSCPDGILKPDSWMLVLSPHLLLLDVLLKPRRNSYRSSRIAVTITFVAPTILNKCEKNFNSFKLEKPFWCNSAMLLSSRYYFKTEIVVILRIMAKAIILFHSKLCIKIKNEITLDDAFHEFPFSTWNKLVSDRVPRSVHRMYSSIQENLQRKDLIREGYTHFKGQFQSRKPLKQISADLPMKVFN